MNLKNVFVYRVFLFIFVFGVMACNSPKTETKETTSQPKEIVIEVMVGNSSYDSLPSDIAIHKQAAKAVTTAIDNIKDEPQTFTTTENGLKSNVKVRISMAQETKVPLPEGWTIAIEVVDFDDRTFRASNPVPQISLRMAAADAIKVWLKNRKEKHNSECGCPEGTSFRALILDSKNKAVPSVQAFIAEQDGSKLTATSSGDEHGYVELNNIPRKCGNGVKLHVSAAGYLPEEFIEDIVLCSEPIRLVRLQKK
ncbi:MAG TPA: hypothetical protein VEA59_00595 [Patescibacteria group bacterium]|nr:hypothetical protein [Patescibacteria group bacterium]